LLFFTDLMLHHNRLEFVWPRTFVGLRSLRRLTLAGNRLTSLPEAMLRHSTALRYLDLADNNCRSLRGPPTNNYFRWNFRRQFPLTALSGSETKTSSNDYFRLLVFFGNILYVTA